MTMITLSVQSTFYLLSASQTSFLSVLKDAPYYLNGEVMGKINTEKPRCSNDFRDFFANVQICKSVNLSSFFVILCKFLGLL